MTGTLGFNLQIFDYYNVIENFVFVESKPVIQNAYTYEENGVLYCASTTQKKVRNYDTEKEFRKDFGIIQQNDGGRNH